MPRSDPGINPPVAAAAAGELDRGGRELVPARLGRLRPARQRSSAAGSWPDVKIALEADGWWHRSPEGATADRQRDSWLRSQGWVVFRIDDEHGEDSLRDQGVRVAHLVRSQAPAGAPWCYSLRSYPDPYIRWPLTKHVPR